MNDAITVTAALDAIAGNNTLTHLMLAGVRPIELTDEILEATHARANADSMESPLGPILAEMYSADHHLVTPADRASYGMIADLWNAGHDKCAWYRLTRSFAYPEQEAVAAAFAAAPEDAQWLADATERNFRG